jgi:hypothetical protein
MPERMTVVVGGRDLLMPLQARTDVNSGSVQVFPTDDVRSAIESILSQRPGYVVLDRDFSRSARGTAMIERLHADPGFSATEILVVHGNDVSPLPTAASETPATPGLDWTGTRRVPRIRMAPGIEAQVDGNATRLVDLSTMGAQVLSNSPLRPNQRVRVNLPGDNSRLVATIQWVNFELPKGKPLPHYRAGMEFVNPDAPALEQFCVAHASTDTAATA